MSNKIVENNKGKIFAIADLHNCYKGYKQAIERANITPEDTLIHLGDYFDRGSEAKELFQHLLKMKNFCNCIFVMGNHDELVLYWLTEKLKFGAYDHFLQMGGYETINSLEKWFLRDPTAKQQVIKFLQNLKPYYIDSENRLFVHAGFDSFKGAEHQFQQNPTSLWWSRYLVEGCFDNNEVYLKMLDLYNEVYVGHTMTKSLAGTYCDVPLFIKNLCALDTGAGSNGKVTIIDIHSKKCYQSDLVKKLYPNN